MAQQKTSTKEDNMGFSFHITTIPKGSKHIYEYKNHLEAVYCISGYGSVESLISGEHFKIEPGTIYALDKHDKHCLNAKTDMVFACVFNPPVVGKEVHDKSGSYPKEG
jgi:L-ectoine synthase